MSLRSLRGAVQLTYPIPLPTGPQHSLVACPQATSTGHGVFLDPEKQKLSHMHFQLIVLVATISFMSTIAYVIKILNLYLTREAIVLQL